MSLIVSSIVKLELSTTSAPSGIVKGENTLFLSSKSLLLTSDTVSSIFD